VGDDIGVLSNGDGGFLDVTCDHSHNDTGLFALVDGFRDTLFQWVLDTSQTQDNEVFFVLFWMFDVLGLLFCEFSVADQERSQRRGGKLV
jgi:hypothetical protein